MKTIKIKIRKHGSDKRKITKDIQAQRSEGIVNSSKIDQAFAKYDLNVDEEEVKTRLRAS